MRFVLPIIPSGIAKNMVAIISGNKVFGRQFKYFNDKKEKNRGRGFKAFCLRHLNFCH